MISRVQKYIPELRKAEIEGLLYILQNNLDIENPELIRQTGIAKPIITKFRTIVGNQEIDGSFKPYSWTLLEHHLVNIEQEIIKIRKKYDLEPKREFDQFFATPYSTAGKVYILDKKGLIEDKAIALIGDDDLVSIALQHVEKKPRVVKVLEIDSDILDTLNSEKVDTCNYDARQQIPRTEENKFDVVLIDPPYTEAGVRLFLYRALQLLKKDGYVLLNFGSGRNNPEKTLKIQDIINRFNLVVEDKIYKYTRYYGAETVGSASSIYVLKKTSFTCLDNSILDTKIYTFENDPMEQFPYVDHFVVKMKKVPASLFSKKQVQRLFGEFCRKHKLKVIDTKIARFKGKGISLTYILAQSNLVAHTWPEHSAIHVDLITCEPIQNREVLGETLSKLFNTKVVEVRRIE